MSLQNAAAQGSEVFEPHRVFGRYSLILQNWRIRPKAQERVPAGRVAGDRAQYLSQFLKHRRCPSYVPSDSGLTGLGVADFDIGVCSEAEQPYVTCELKQPTDDHEILEVLPRDYHSYLWGIARFTETQRAGEEGFLLSNGDANISYLRRRDGSDLVAAIRCHVHEFRHRWCLILRNKYRGTEP